ncbi:MAG: hypothetical protein JSS66_11590 [Armatimonadetes bacterium]|nr:hypothetical protein [Armatimonadota bacterium]
MYRHVIVALAVAATSVAQASALINGSFEQPGSSVFNQFNNGEVPGWTAQAGKTIEIGVPVVYGVTNYDGLNVMEVDSTENVTVKQTVTLASGSYDLSFLFAERGKNMVGKPADTCDFDVLWNNTVVAHYRPDSTVMSLADLHVNALQGSNTVAFRGSGTSDGYGAILDKVELNPVPEPSLCAALGISALAALRRKKR